MSFTQNPVATRVKQPQCAMVSIGNGNGTAWQTLLTAGANGSKVVGIVISSTDGTARGVQLSINNGSNFILGTIPVPANAGTNTTVTSASAFGVITLPIDNDGNPYFFVPGSNTVQVASVNTVGSGNTILVTAFYGDF